MHEFKARITFSGPTGSGAPGIEITSLPPFGSQTDVISGRVWHVSPGQYRLGVFAQINGVWYVRPYADYRRFVLVQADGSWSCERIEPNTTRVAIFVFPAAYVPPIVFNDRSLPSVLDANAIAKIEISRAPYAVPQIASIESLSRAIAFDSVIMVREPFSVLSEHNFSPDHRTRVMLFVIGAILAGENPLTAVTAEAEDNQHRIFQLPVEYAGAVSNARWLTQVNVRLPDQLQGAGEVQLRVGVRGMISQDVRLRIQ